LFLIESLTDNGGTVQPTARWASDKFGGDARGMIMPRTKKRQPVPRSQPQPPPSSFNGPSGEVLTLAEAAAYLRLPEAAVVGLVHSQGLPGRCIASEWRFLKAAIESWLGAASPTWDVRKAAILELAGKYKEDAELEQIVEDAYRRRGRPVTEGSSSKNPGN
jgi:hypothetical protein